jgi:mono/diheme cytochrome c family protein
MKSGKKLIKILWLLPVLFAVPAYFASAALTGQQIYDQYCAKCHKLGSYDSSGSPDLLGDGSRVNEKFNGGKSRHKGVRLTSTDITNVAAFLNNPTTTVPLAIVTTSFPDAMVGTSYSQILTATGGKTPYTWSRSAGTLPTGLTLNSSGVISGTLSAAGTFTFTAKVTDSAAASDTKTLSITVSPATPPLVIATTSLPDGTAGSAYSQTLAATGGTTPYSWSASGTLPAGLSVTSGGTVTGTPTTSGSYNFSVLVVDAKSVSATRTLALTVAAPVSTPMSTEDKNLFLTNCVTCHTPSGLEYRSSSQILSAIRGNVGGMGTTQLKALTTANIDGIARTLVPGTPEVISCNTCHSSSPPPTSSSGQAIYDTNCSSCHKLGSYDTSGSAPDLYQSTRIDSYFSPGSSGHKGITLSATDISNLKAFLNNPSSTPPPTPDPTPTPTSGQQVYDNNCAGCHKLSSYDTSGSAPDLYQSTRIDSYFSPGSSGHKGITLSATDISNLKAFLNNPSSTPPPTPDPTPVTGQTVYDNNCASCHRLGTYDTSGSAPNLSRYGSDVSEKYTPGVSGHRGITLTATELSSLSAFLNAH